jgi:hypothetical protein
MMPVSVNCPFLIDPSVFYNVYRKRSVIIIFYNIEELLCARDWSNVCFSEGRLLFIYVGETRRKNPETMSCSQCGAMQVVFIPEA